MPGPDSDTDGKYRTFDFPFVSIDWQISGESKPGVYNKSGKLGHQES